MEKIAIIGFGCAGYNALKAIRENGFKGDIFIYTPNNQPPHNPMLTTYYLESKLFKGSMFPFGTIEEIKAKYDFNLILEEVLEITPYKKVVTNSSAIKYDKILIATGATPFIPTDSYKGKKNIFVMRTAEDAQKLEEFFLSKKLNSALVVGASMVGIKVSEMFVGKNISTTLIDMGENIFPLSAFKGVAQSIEYGLLERGLKLRMGCALNEILQEESNLKVNLNGDFLNVDCVVLCIGTKPRLSMIKSPLFSVCGGLIVDRTMESTVKGIFAAGDCTAGYDFQLKSNRPIGLWDVAWEQGKIAGENICENNAIYKGNSVRNITKFFDMTFTSMGDVSVKGQDFSYKDIINNWEIVVRMNGDIISAINILNNPALSGVLKGVFTKKYLSGENSHGPIIKSLLIDHKLPLDMIELILGGVENE